MPHTTLAFMGNLSPFEVILLLLLGCGGSVGIGIGVFCIGYAVGKSRGAKGQP